MSLSIQDLTLAHLNMSTGGGTILHRQDMGGHGGVRAGATPISGSVQDVPPPGGYPKIFYKERLGNRGPPSWALWTGTILLVAYGFIQVGRTNTERRFWADKKREQKLALVPLLQAEEDLNWISKYKKALQEEADIMRHRPDWKVGESVYKTRVTWIPPSVWPYSK